MMVRLVLCEALCCEKRSGKIEEAKRKVTWMFGELCYFRTPSAERAVKVRSVVVPFHVRMIEPESTWSWEKTTYALVERGTGDVNYTDRNDGLLLGKSQP
jgi:hypothetical protein